MFINIYVKLKKETYAGMCGHGGTVTRRWFTQFVPAGRSSAAPQLAAQLRWRCGDLQDSVARSSPASPLPPTLPPEHQNTNCQAEPSGGLSQYRCQGIYQGLLIAVESINKRFQ